MSDDLIQRLRGRARQLDNAGDGLGYYSRGDAILDREAADTLASKDTALAEIRAENERLREDAERWRALMSSQRMHFMGCAGIDLVNKPGTTSRKTADLIPVMKPGEYQHFGMEFWSEHKAFGDPEYPDDFERSLLVAYVDNLRAASRALSQDGEETK